MKADLGFSNYKEIKVEATSRCAKFTKNRFILFLIFIIIILFILIIILAYKNKQYNKKDTELSRRKNNINEMNSKLLKTINQTEVSNYTLNSMINELSNKQKLKDKIKDDYKELKNQKDKLKYNRNDLLGKQEYIINQINYKKKILKEELVKNEIQEKKNLIQKMKKKLNDLSINNSAFKINVEYFESITNTKILNRCYDSEIYGFHINKFHDNCDGYALLILMQTKNDQKIGAFISESIDGTKEIYDEKSLIIDLDKNEYFFHNLKKECFIYFDIDEFPRLGNDLIIFRDGYIEYKSFECYNNKENIERKTVIDENKIAIDTIEVYKVKLKINSE